MPKTQKNKKRKPKQRKPISRFVLPVFYRNLIFILLAMIVLGTIGWFCLKISTIQRYPGVYADWWKASIQLEQDSRDGKKEIDHAQTWLTVSIKLIRMKQPMFWIYREGKEQDPFSILLEMTEQVALQPDKVLMQLETIQSIHQVFYAYHQRLGLTKNVFLADRLLIEWSQLKMLLQNKADSDKIHQSIQLINMQIPLLSSCWLYSDVSTFTALGDTCEKLWMNERFDQMLQLLLDNDSSLIRACLDANY